MSVITNVPFPSDNSWTETLRFIVQTMDKENMNLDFMVSLWSYAIAHDGLTEKQANKIRAFAEKYIVDFKDK